MARQYWKSWALILGLAVILASGLAYAQTPQEIAINDCVMNSGVFPPGTSIVSLVSDGDAINVDLSAEAIPAGFADGQSDSYTEALFAAVSAWPEVNAINITVGGIPITAYLPPNTLPDFAPSGDGGLGSQSVGQRNLSALAAQNPLLPPSVPTLGSELAGKLIVLGPSHGAYANTSNWTRAQRTLCGPNPNSPVFPSAYMPSDYYYYTKGYTWPMYYEDDMSPETIRFLSAYCKAAGAYTYVNRNLDKTAGLFPYALYGYPNPGFTLPKWMTASKYYLQDLGGIPSTVWNTSDVTLQSDKDLRARAYYVNWLMGQLGVTYQNTLYLALHSNAATATQCTPNQAQARGTEDYDSVAYTTWTTQQARSSSLASTLETNVINSIRLEYDGFWANSEYNLANPPPEWCTGYGTYRGYDHAAAATPATTAGWQNRGPKSGNYGEIRECKCSAVLMELLFHDNWKFYPDEAFHNDMIFRSTVAWGMYEGFCAFWSVTPRTRLNASVDSTSFPTGFVAPGVAINGTVVMKDLGQAWCWGNKMVGTSWAPYTIWDLQGTAADQFGKSGTKIQIANDGIYYPGDTASFAIALTAPSTSGTYTTAWRMVKDDQRGGSFGPTATAQIQVDADAPVINVTSPTEGALLGPSVTITFDVSDPLSGVDTVSAKVDGIDVTSGSTMDLGTGTHSLVINATDKVGNTSSKTVSFDVDADPPVISVSSPAEGALLGPSVPVNFSVTDAKSGVQSFSAAIDGNPVSSGSNATLATGAHSLVINATDVVGNAASKTVTFNVDADAPVITISSPSAINYGRTGSVAISFSAADAISGVASVTATLDGNPVANGSSFGLLFAAFGPHTLVVTSVDNVGNVGSKSVTFQVIATIESMIAAVNELYAMGQIDNQGIQNSLLVKLAKYEKDTGDNIDAKNYLKNFINEVSAQSGKHLTAVAADKLLADANYCIAHLP